MALPVSSVTRIGFLGPSGTFTEEALRTQVDLVGCRLNPQGSFSEVLDSLDSGETDLGFVALENSIEGTVNIALDRLVFDHDLLILREVVLPVTQNLLTLPGAGLDGVRSVVSFPHATGQCREWLHSNVPDAEELPAKSTAEAARQVASGGRPDTAAIGTRLAASIYGLSVAAAEIEDQRDNLTRFVLLGRPDAGVPAATGHDKTTIVCFQSKDRPGSLHGILGQFSARDINLVKLESRPTKKALGDYCFIIDFEGHVSEEVVADCLRDLHASLREIKYLGSYPAAGPHGEQRRRDADESWRSADDWIASIRERIR